MSSVWSPACSTIGFPDCAVKTCCLYTFGAPEPAQTLIPGQTFSKFSQIGCSDATALSGTVRGYLVYWVTEVHPHYIKSYAFFHYNFIYTITFTIGISGSKRTPSLINMLECTISPQRFDCHHPLPLDMALALNQVVKQPIKQITPLAASFQVSPEYPPLITISPTSVHLWSSEYMKCRQNMVATFIDSLSNFRL